MAKKKPNASSGAGSTVPQTPTTHLKDTASLKDFWLEIQSNESLSGNIFKITKEDVLAEVQHDKQDLNLVKLAIDCLESRGERGSSDWIAGKLSDTALKIVVPPLSGKENDISTEALALAAKLETAAAAVFAVAGIPDLNTCFLSKLPDGVFISGNTARALGRLRIDFATYQEHVSLIISHSLIDIHV